MNAKVAMAMVSICNSSGGSSKYLCDSDLRSLLVAMRETDRQREGVGVMIATTKGIDRQTDRERER